MSKKFRVAMVAPPFGEIGGPEIVVKNLTNVLLKKGIDVTLFAPADWHTSARHIPTLPQSVWNMKDFRDHTTIVRQNLIIDSQVKVLQYEHEFDILHLHQQRHAYIVGKNSKKPCVLSLHSNITPADFQQIQEAGIYTVSLSKSQKGNLKTSATIWNGVTIDTIPYSTEPGEYLIAIGRLDEQKGIDMAIQIALRAKKKLLIFGRIGNSKERKEYFNKKIKPFIDGKKIVYKKEVPNDVIHKYLSHASALIFSIKGPEVCPVAVMESLAAGTPVIGTTIAPLPEMVGGNKKISFLSDNIKALARAAASPHIFDRKECRRYAQKHFSSATMADKYIALYKKILNVQ